MKFINFFKTTWGIIILAIVIIAIILIVFNWAAISAWWNAETPGANERGIIPGTTRVNSVGGIERWVCRNDGGQVLCAWKAES